MTALATVGHDTGIVAVGERGIQLRGLDELTRFSKNVHQSGLFPQFKTEAACAMAIETCLELGLKPMLAMPKMMVINGKVGLMGDLALGIVRASPVCEYVKDGIAGDGDNKHAWVESKRKDTGEIKRTTFSVADAKRAGLWGKAGPWLQYPQRQLYYRALGFNLRDNFSDVLLGQTIAEELGDYPAAEPRTIASVVTAPHGPDALLDALEPATVQEVAETQPTEEPKAEVEGSGAPPRPEQLVIRLSEFCECTELQARKKLESFSKNVFKSHYGELNDKQLDDIEAKIVARDIVV